jgi:hypothetical protein
LILPHLEKEFRSVFWEAIKELKVKTPLNKITTALLADSLQDPIAPVPALEWEHKGIVLDSVKDLLDCMLSRVAAYDGAWEVEGQTLDDKLVVLFEHANIVAKELSKSLVLKSCEKHFLFGRGCLRPHKCDELLKFDAEKSKEKVTEESLETIERCGDGFWGNCLEIHLSELITIMRYI